MISPIGAEGSEVRKNADLLFSFILKPVLNDCGYEALRADMMAVPGLVNPHIIRHIVEDDLAIADLTGSNPNVFYELAIRHVIRKPYIHLIREHEQIPFDVKDVHTIYYSIDVGKITKAKDLIRAQIEYFEGGEPVVSPFSMTMDILGAQNRDSTTAQLVELMTQLQRLEGSIKDLPKPEPTDSREDLVRTLNEKLTTITNQVVEVKNKVDKIGPRSSDRQSGGKHEGRSLNGQSSSQETGSAAFPGLTRHAAGKSFTVSEWIDRENRARVKRGD